MRLDTTPQKAFARKWPLWRIFGVLAFFAFTIGAMYRRHPTEWFVVPAAMALQELLRDARDAFRKHPAAA